MSAVSASRSRHFYTMRCIGAVHAKHKRCKHTRAQCSTTSSQSAACLRPSAFHRFAQRHRTVKQHRSMPPSGRRSTRSPTVAASRLAAVASPSVGRYMRSRHPESHGSPSETLGSTRVWVDTVGYLRSLTRAGNMRTACPLEWTLQALAPVCPRLASFTPSVKSCALDTASFIPHTVARLCAAKEE